VFHNFKDTENVCVHTLWENNIPNPLVNENRMAAHAWVEVFLCHNPMIAQSTES
jgi:hypothetical protein